MKRLSQKDMVLNHLKKFGHITQLEAYENYGAFRLSALIYILRNEGYNIESLWETSKNRFGVSVTYTKYQLKGEI